MDYETLGAAIAARFATAVVPTGEDVLALCTAEPPDELGAGPAIVVFPPEEPLMEWGPALTLHSVQLWPVRFFRVPGPDYAARMAALSKWRKALYTTVVGQIQLGLTGVDWAELRSIAVKDVEYGGASFDCLDMVVAVKVREQVAAQA